jgi:hypothetical protein
VPEPDATYKQIVDWLFGKGTTNVNIVDINLSKPERSLPVSVRNTRGPATGTGGGGSSSTSGSSKGSATKGEGRLPWWTERE